MAFEAAVGCASFVVTIRAIVHFHAVPCFESQSRDDLSFDIPAVTADPVDLTIGQRLALPMRTMTSFAFNLCNLDMLDVREIDIVGLAGVCAPGDFPIMRNKLINKPLFCLTLSEYFGMAFFAVGKSGDRHGADIRREGVAVVARHADGFSRMDGVAELQRLRFLLIEQ